MVNYQISMDHAITVGNQLLFSRSISNALYVTNGKGSGTQAINPPMDVQSDFININGSAYFFADEQLWKSDGSAAGKKLVHDDIAGTGFTRFKGAIYFTAGVQDEKHGLFGSLKPGPDAASTLQ